VGPASEFVHILDGVMESIGDAIKGGAEVAPGHRSLYDRLREQVRQAKQRSGMISTTGDEGIARRYASDTRTQEGSNPTLYVIRTDGLPLCPRHALTPGQLMKDYHGSGLEEFLTENEFRELLVLVDDVRIRRQTDDEWLVTAPIEDYQPIPLL
jgi:hypothetical protein